MPPKGSGKRQLAAKAAAEEAASRERDEAGEGEASDEVRTCSDWRSEATTTLMHGQLLSFACRCRAACVAG